LAEPTDLILQYITTPLAEQNRKVIDIVLKKGPSAFQQLLLSLSYSNQHIANKLTEDCHRHIKAEDKETKVAPIQLVSTMKERKFTAMEEEALIDAKVSFREALRSDWNTCYWSTVSTVNDLFEWAKKRRESILGKDHPVSIATNQHLYNFYGTTRSSNGALELLGDIYKCQIRALGKDHPDTLETLKALNSGKLVLLKLNEPIQYDFY
jgi:hypothetical protein